MGQVQNLPLQPGALPADATSWQLLLQALPDPAWVVALPSLRLLGANAAAGRLFGLAQPQLLGTRADHLLATPEDMAWWDLARTDLAAAGPLDSEALLQAADGRTVVLHRTVHPLTAAASGPCIVIARDLTAERQALAAQEDLAAELQATLEATADGILVTDLGGGIRAFNRRFAQLWGMPETLLEARRDEAVQAWMRRVVEGPEAYERRLQALQDSTLLASTDRLTLLSGQVLERVVRPLWSRGRPLGRVWSFRDLSERMAADERLDVLARTDALTGLANRRQLAEQVAATALAMRHDGDAFALLVFDLDRFRHVNDSLGHEIGDRALREVAVRLQRVMRAGDVVARIGGDQFATLLRHADAPAAEAAAHRVLAAMAEPWQFDGMAFTLTCSVGIALAPGHGRNADELLRHAESAMRGAKSSGSNGLRFHQQHAEGDLRSHMRLDHAMRQALASQRFRLHYQPQVDLATGEVVGAEALIRWRDPALGEVPPGRFIPVAEDTGFIIAIGDWVLEQAARQAAAWAAEGRALTVAVNVSALQFRQADFVERVASVLDQHALPPQRLELELTESILVRDADEALERLRALANLGVRLSIDDFGTGYSSLGRLKSCPIHRLKIDRSFIRGLPDDARDAALVRAIVQMGQALGLNVVAEGVETEPQRRFLREIGCHDFQGFLFAPGMDAVSFGRRFPAAGADAPTVP
ncbi:MAG: EAL domain-containing protein [Burkholderiaceae bacterium]|nr:EAL domain-containing protein [Burkholderiaceae bacterium]